MADINKTLPLPIEDSEEPSSGGEAEPALNLIRQKVASLYQGEPSVKQEEAEIEQLGAQSKHQKYIEQLMESGKSIAEIQTAWHEYYQSLDDANKRQVWQEFYANHQRGSAYFAKTAPTGQLPKKPAPETPKPKHLQLRPTEPITGNFKTDSTDKSESSTITTLKKYLLDTIIARGKLNKKHHLKSLLFGVGMGLLVIFILMFGFFNERFIAPFITPSKNISNSSIIIDPNSSTVAADPLVIIPKINVEIPVVYDVASIEASAMSEGLMRGVLHYPLSPVPGQNGNVVVVGHSSNNIFNKGKYKFAFVLLSRLEEGDTFMLNYNGKRYIYRVYTKKIVSPSDVSVLGSTDRTATATLITCDPPGTAMNRLVVIGEQISPAIADNAVAVTTAPTEQPQIVPGNAESLFHRLFSWIWE